MKCLYITYDGLLDPLGQSQILPYIKSLVSRGHIFTIISFEKQDRSVDSIIALEKSLADIGIRWERLAFKKGNFQKFNRVIYGIVSIWKNRLQSKYDVVHLRGFMAGAIYRASFLNTPFIYDIRAFIGEWVDIGQIKEDTWIGRMLIGIDRSLVEKASGLVVLDKSGELLLQEIYNLSNAPLKVIRTCTDTSLYSSADIKTSTQDKEILKFVFLGGAIIPYRPDLALKFVSELIKQGLNCHIDFINERDHVQIYEAVNAINFPKDRFSVYKLDKSSIPAALQHFDCGLIFNNSSRWRRVSSPTKFGEYLAAGIHTVALNGISVLEEFAESSDCVDLVSEKDLYAGLKKDSIDKIIFNINKPNRGIKYQELAEREFSLKIAGHLYSELYSEIQTQISQRIHVFPIKRIFYHTMDGISDHLGQSQVLPYIFGCSEKHKYYLFSHEKNLNETKEDEQLQQQLLNHSVTWNASQFTYGKGVRKVLITCLGILRAYKSIFTFKPDVLHGRGFISSVILAAYSKIFKIPFIYDFRSFSVEEWHEIGTYKKNSFYHKFLSRIDRWAIASASCVIVLTHAAKHMLLEENDIHNIHVIPTSVQAIKQPQKSEINTHGEEIFKFVYSGGAKYPYKFKELIEFLHILGLIFPVELTIYNKADVSIIESLLLDISPSFDYQILNLPHRELLATLPSYDCALFLIDVTPVRSTCCPTKLGEFLSAGLPILTCPGITIVDDIKQQYGCIFYIDHLIGPADNIVDISLRLNEVKDFINNSKGDLRSSKKAFDKNFDIKVAITSYLRAYKSIAG